MPKSYIHFSEQIEKTGFVLENQVAQLLKAAHWTVISNRYYVDDTEESVREIDLIAYQVSRIQHFDVYTVLVISCKKSDSNAWALLARQIDLEDPNSDWYPLHAWSNDKALSYQLAISGCPKRYHGAIADHGAKNVLETPDVEVFAFQEMNKTSGVPQNDKSIFAAVTTLMKAQAYELGALPQRKKTPSVYQFNLLSIVDTDLVRLMFSGETIAATPVDSAHYIARYIIKKRETFSRIRFLSAKAFPEELAEYGFLHQANCQWFYSECNAFYQDIVQDSKRMELLVDDFRKQTSLEIHRALMRNNLNAQDSSTISLYWNRTASSLRVWAGFGAEGAKVLNADPKVKAAVAGALQSIYRYSGQFEFEDDDIPF